MFVHNLNAQMCPGVCVFVHNLNAQMCPVVCVFVRIMNAQMCPGVCVFVHILNAQMCPGVGVFVCKFVRARAHSAPAASSYAVSSIGRARAVTLCTHVWKTTARCIHGCVAHCVQDLVPHLAAMHCLGLDLVEGFLW